MHSQTADKHSQNEDQQEIKACLFGLRKNNCFYFLVLLLTRKKKNETPFNQVIELNWLIGLTG
jgi:hypothetical protein